MKWHFNDIRDLAVFTIAFFFKQDLQIPETEKNMSNTSRNRYSKAFFLLKF